jgi:hypothetical protein
MIYDFNILFKFSNRKSDFNDKSRDFTHPYFHPPPRLTVAGAVIVFITEKLFKLKCPERQRQRECVYR